MSKRDRYREPVALSTEHGRVDTMDVREAFSLADPDVGDTYSLTIERHASEPSWRLRERRVIKGEVFESVTQWREFRLFSPELGMAQGRMRRFLFPQFGTGRLPQREIADK